MDWQAVLNSIDRLFFQHTGKHLDNLQVAILKGVLQGQKYAEIAEGYRCSVGHVKDEGYKLWQVLSEVFGEDLNKSNFCATVERLGVANSYSSLINPVQIGHLNICSNADSLEAWNGNSGRSNIEDNSEKSSNTNIESVLRANKLEAVSKLVDLGLTSEQIAEALDLSLDDVREAMK